MKVRYFSTVILILVLQMVAAQQIIDEIISDILIEPEYKNAQVGIHILDMSSGETVYGLNADKLFIPASIMKLITTATALEILGPEYTFKTRIGYIGKIKNETLKGDLVISGGGDPALGSEFFESHYFNPHFLNVWAEQIKNFGILRVDGNLVLDGSFYDFKSIPDTWIWEDIGNYYGVGPNALTVYDNLFRITFKSPKRAGENTSIISVSPEIEELEIRNEVLSSDVNKDLAYVFGSPLDKIKVIQGTIPKNQKSFAIKAAVHQPEELLAADLTKHLAQKGIFITGRIVYEKTNPVKSETIYTQESPPLEEIIKTTNYESNNLAAEHLLKQLSAEKTGKGNRKESIEMVQDFWKEREIETENLFIEDGSGLSHFNAVPPVFFTAVLNYMYNFSLNKTSFYSSLPAAGEGTLSGFHIENFPDSSLKAKSGSMTRVRCYSGYLKTDSGKDFAFCFMFNHYSGSSPQLVSKIEKVLVEIKNTF